MTDLRPHIQELLLSPARLAQCAGAGSVAELFALLKQYWQQPRLSDDELLAGLQAGCSQPFDLDPWTLASHWLPQRYDARQRTLEWCLPNGRPLTPFFDQFLGECRQLTINQILRPRTPITRLLEQPAATPGAPAGFIFHVSRCGSTLVSGALAELEHSLVLSESPLLTEVLLDPGLRGDERATLLRACVDLQQRSLGARRALIVKWNAWDLFHWPLIRSLYPRVPALLLVRDPVEVLASHQTLCGRHMSGDPSLGWLDAACAGMRPEESVLDYRGRVLHALLQTLLRVGTQPGVLLLDHGQLDPARVESVARFFGLYVSRDERHAIQRRMQFHSKDLSRPFTPDGQRKRQGLSEQERDRVRARLDAPYRQALALSAPRVRGVALC